MERPRAKTSTEMERQWDGRVVQTDRFIPSYDAMQDRHLSVPLRASMLSHMNTKSGAASVRGRELLTRTRVVNAASYNEDDGSSSPRQSHMSAPISKLAVGVRSFRSKPKLLLNERPAVLVNDYSPTSDQQRPSSRFMRGTMRGF